jgi:membrane protein
MKPVIASIRLLVARVMKLRAVRVFQLYSQKNGGILAGGLSLTLLYSVFAGIYVGFAVVGIVAASNQGFEDAIVRTVSGAVPGLIDSGGNGGAIKVNQLFASHTLTISSIVALIAVLVTALSWFSSARSAVRLFFQLPQDTTFFLLLKLKDLALVIGFGVVVLVSAGLSVFSTSALDFLFGLVGIDHHSPFATLVARAVGLLLVLAIDTLTLATLFRVLAATRIPLRRLIVGSLLGGIGLGVLTVLGATIVGGAGRNPLLASFAVILGLLVWMGLVCQVILLSATWIAVDVADHGQSLQPKRATKSLRTPPTHQRPMIKAVSPPR